MKTEFSLTQIADPDIAAADKILRACVHCGFCTAPVRPMCCSATSSIARAGGST
jgi:heterodisulfide reductase subunit C